MSVSTEIEPTNETLRNSLRVLPLPILARLDEVNFSAPENSLDFQQYVMTGVSFKPLRAFFETNNRSELAEPLMRQLWISFLEHSTATYPMSRNPGNVYVLLDLARSQEQVIAECIYFFQQVAPAIIETFMQAHAVIDLEYSVRDFMIVSVGGQIDASKPAMQPCRFDLVRYATEGETTAAQNAPVSTPLIFGATVHHAYLGYIDKVNPDIPLIIDDAHGSILAAVSTKGVAFRGRTCSIEDINKGAEYRKEALVVKGQLEAKAVQLPSEVLSEALEIRFEVPYTLKELERMFAEGNETEINVFRERTNKDLDAAEIKLEAIETRELGGSDTPLAHYVDLSGMSKIIDRIETFPNEMLKTFAIRDLNEAVDDFQLAELRAVIRRGAQEFFQKWIVGSAAIQEWYGGSSFEFGGDGFKVLDKQEVPKRLEEWVRASLQSARYWEDLLAKMVLASDPTAATLFALFMTHEINQGHFDQVITKTVLAPGVPVSIVKYGNFMYEVRIVEAMEVLADIHKDFFKDHSSQLKYIDGTGVRRTRPFVIMPKPKMENVLQELNLEANQWLIFEVEAQGSQCVVIVDMSG